jgi:hypothetical protein
VARYLPQFKFSKPELRMLPLEFAQLADELLDGARTEANNELPSGFPPRIADKQAWCNER